MYNGVHDSKKWHTTQKSIKVIGYHGALLKQGISDPLNYTKNIIAKMEKSRKEEIESKNKLKIWNKI